MPIIVFDETHNERVLLRTWTHLRDLFQRHNIDIEQYTDFPITADKIQVADIFVFGCPDGSKLYEYEIKTLVNYVEKGGNLFVLGHSGGDRGLMSNMNLLLENFDIEFMSNQVIDNVDCWDNIPTHVIIKNFEQHPAVEDITTFCYISGCSLVVDPPTKAIAFSGYHAETPKKPVIAVRNYGQGKVCAIGCHRSFSGYRAGISLFDNSQLLIKIVQWLLDKEEETPSSSTPITSEVPSPSTPEISSTSPKIENQKVVTTPKRVQRTLSKQTKGQIRPTQTQVRKIQPKGSKIKRISPDSPSVMKVSPSRLSTPSKPFSTPDGSISSSFLQDLSTLKSDVQALHQIVNEVKNELKSLKGETNQKIDELMKELKVIGSIIRLKKF
ncbi:MAG: hypothetical protein ACFFDI_11775 [Promethearchaeota archaeon]